MESTADAEEATARLKRKYAQLRNDIHENDKRTELAQRKYLSALHALKQQLHRRSTLAFQVCQFAQEFTGACADDSDLQAELESLRRLCEANCDHIHGLTAVLAHLQDDEGACRTDGPAAGDEKSAPKSGRSAEPQLRPKDDFFEFLGKSRKRSKHPEADLVSQEVAKKTAPTCGASPAKGRHDRQPVAQAPVVSPLVYALIVVAAFTSVPFLCPDTVWHRIFDKYLKAPASEPPLQPATPMSVLQRARTFCGL